MPTNIDLTITKIHMARHWVFPDWSRSKAIPRYATGLIYVTEGSVCYDFCGKTIESNAGDILFLPKGIVYSGVSLSELNSFYVIDFDCTAGNPAIPFLPLQIKSAPPEIERDFERVAALWNSTEPTRNLQCRAGIYKLLSKVYEYNNNLSGSRHEYVVEAIKYIRDHFADPGFYVKQIAESIHVSESHLRRLFINDLGLSPIEYLQTCRIEHAKEMLLYSFDSLGTIAEKCGYSSLFYFSKIFKKTVGLSPKEYRSRECGTEETDQ